MERDHPTANCFVIPIKNDFLIYSPLNAITALTNQAGVRELKKKLLVHARDQGDPDSTLSGLAQDILNGRTKIPKMETGNLNPDFIGVIPTRSCNGACTYCDFGALEASSQKMPYRMATKFVDWYAGLLKSQKRNVLEIHFFGGEPMMAQDVIEVTVQRARLVSAELNLIAFFEISTNGQYSARKARFLGDYFNKVVLSLDGFKEVQDNHRPLPGNKSSFENAIETARIISNSNAELCIRCCISGANIMMMEEFTHWLCQHLKISTINFEILCSTPQANSAGLFPPDPVVFAIQFQKSRQIADDYGVEVIYASDISEIPVRSSCPVGKDTAILTPEGRISNCYLMPERWQNVGLDLDFGSIDDSGLVRINELGINNIRKMVGNKQRCTNCYCKYSCAGGCHVGNTYPGSNPGFNDFCRQTRIISAFTLLSDLNLHDRIEDLINRPDSIRNIADQASDIILDFN